MEQNSNLYPTLNQPIASTTVPTRPTNSPSTQTATPRLTSNATLSTPTQQTLPLTVNQQRVDSDLQSAKQWELKGEWKMALDIYTNLAQFGFENPESMTKSRLSGVIARAEAIKIRLEPEDLLLNIPDGVRLVKNSGEKTEAEAVSVAFTLKQVSKWVVFNASNLVQFYIKDCYFLKKDIGNGKFVYSVQNTSVNKVYTIELDSEKMGKEYIETFDEIVKKQAIEFRDSDLAQLPTQVPSTQVPSTQASSTHVSPTQASTTSYPRGPAQKESPTQIQPSNSTTADKLSSGITTTSHYIGEGVDYLSIKAKEAYSNYSTNYVETKKPNEKPTEVSDTTMKVLAASKTTTRHTAAVAGTVAGWIGSAVKFGAGKIGEHIEKKYVPDKTGEKKDQESNLDKVIKVGGSSIAAIGSIWNNLEKNGRDVGRAVREDTVKMVDHTHGEKAAKATDDGFRTAIDGTRTVFYINDMGIKAIAKSTAKQAGKTVVKIQKDKRDIHNSNQIQMN